VARECVSPPGAGAAGVMRSCMAHLLRPAAGAARGEPTLPDQPATAASGLDNRL
jgi:hypothetical protein